MIDRPQTHYTTIEGADVAYQVIGDGQRDFLWCHGLASNIEIALEYSIFTDLYSRFESLGRLVVFDRRGTGASARSIDAFSTWEEWTQDIQAVLDAVGSERATLFGFSDSGPIAMLYAALHPERVDSLLLLNTWSRLEVADDFPIGAPREDIEARVELVRALWGTADLVRYVTPSSIFDDDATYERVARMLRHSATPNAAAAQFEYIYKNVDVRSALPLIQAPTLVLHDREAPFLSVEHGRYLSEHIEHAKLVELPGPWVGPIENPAIMDEIEEFMTGVRSAGSTQRVLTTILFCDIVGSTSKAASLGDRRWRELLDRHDSAVRDELRRYRGCEVKTTGDGFVASFDGPARAIQCASAIVRATAKLGISVRVGLHTGECEVRGDDLGGIAVHIAARVGALAGDDEVLVSGTVKDLVIGSGIEFDDRGEHPLKGVPGTWKLFAIAG